MIVLERRITEKYNQALKRKVADVEGDLRDPLFVTTFGFRLFEAPPTHPDRSGARDIGRIIDAVLS